jgi:hypothetical protein
MTNEREYYEALMKFCSDDYPDDQNEDYKKISWNITAVKFHIRPCYLDKHEILQKITEFDKSLVVTKDKKHNGYYFISLDEIPETNSPLEIGKILGYIDPINTNEMSERELDERDGIQFFIRNNKLILYEGEAFVYSESCDISKNILDIDKLLTKFCDFTNKLGLYGYMLLAKNKNSSPLFTDTAVSDDVSDTVSDTEPEWILEPAIYHVLGPGAGDIINEARKEPRYRAREIIYNCIGPGAGDILAETHGKIFIDDESDNESDNESNKS